MIDPRDLPAELAEYIAEHPPRIRSDAILFDVVEQYASEKEQGADADA